MVIGKSFAELVQVVFKPSQHVHPFMQNFNNAGRLFFRMDIKYIVMFTLSYPNLRIAFGKGTRMYGSFGNTPETLFQ